MLNTASPSTLFGVDEFLGPVRRIREIAAEQFGLGDEDVSFLLDEEESYGGEGEDSDDIGPGY